MREGDHLPPSGAGQEERLTFVHALLSDLHTGSTNCPNAAGCEEQMNKQI
jgi:hypothetical protein